MNSLLIHGEGFFSTEDGAMLFEQWWLPQSAAKAIVIIVHGYAEHSSRYAQLAEFLTHNGYAVYAFDLRGHGYSEGERVFAGLFDKHIIDLEHFFARVRKKESVKKIFLLGHSIGGTIVTLFTITGSPDAAGIILSAPCLMLPNNIHPIQLKLVQMFGSIMPRLPVAKKIDSRLISNNAQRADNYKFDPLIYHRPIQAREVMEIIQAVEAVQLKMKNLTLPFMILHGALDRLVSIEGSRQLYEQAGSQDKALKIYAGIYHEILNDNKNESALADLIKWLDERIIL